MIEGVTRPFEFDHPQPNPEQVAETAQLYAEGIRRVYERFSPDNPEPDWVQVNVPLGNDESVSFNISNICIIGFADQMHTWGYDKTGAIERLDGQHGDTMGLNTPERERIRPANDSEEALRQSLEDGIAERDKLGMNQRVFPDEVRKLFDLIMSGELDVPDLTSRMGREPVSKDGAYRRLMDAILDLPDDGDDDTHYSI